MTNDPRLPKLPFNFFQRAGYNFFQVLDHFITRRITVKLLGKLRYMLFLNMVKSLKAKGKGKLIPIERRDDLSIKEFYEYYVKNGIPVVFNGAAKDWDCVKKWSLEYFKDIHGDDEDDSGSAFPANQAQRIGGENGRPHEDRAPKGDLLAHSCSACTIILGMRQPPSCVRLRSQASLTSR